MKTDVRLSKILKAFLSSIPFRLLLNRPLPLPLCGPPQKSFRSYCDYDLFLSFYPHCNCNLSTSLLMYAESLFVSFSICMWRIIYLFIVWKSWLGEWQLIDSRCSLHDALKTFLDETRVSSCDWVWANKFLDENLYFDFVLAHFSPWKFIRNVEPNGSVRRSWIFLVIRRVEWTVKW
jgi:hypothetical protein